MFRVYFSALFVAFLLFVAPSFSLNEDSSFWKINLTNKILKEEGDFLNLFSTINHVPSSRSREHVHDSHHHHHGHHHHHNAHAPSKGGHHHHHHHAHAPSVAHYAHAPSVAHHVHAPKHG